MKIIKFLISFFILLWVAQAEADPYIVGYRNFYWINPHHCPDPYFKNNKTDYSSNNLKYCREINITVYYPAQTSEVHSSPYYQPAVMGWEQEFAKLPKKVRPKLNRENFVIQAGENLSPNTKQKFPVVLFCPGFDVNGNEYSNVLINLASNGYIVVVINNSFIGDLVPLSNGHVIKHQAKWIPKAWDVAKTDILFVRENLKRLQKNSELPLMDLEKIALLGHSMGGMIVVDLAHKKPGLFQAAVALDASYQPEWSDPHTGFQIPFLHIHAANWATRKSPKSNFILSKNEYFITLSSNKNQTDYTRHMIFSDFATLQYLPETQKLLAYYRTAKPGKDILDVGVADGKKMQLVISDYILAFLNQYLKNEKDSRLDQCRAFSSDTRIVCGPQIINIF